MRPAIRAAAGAVALCVSLAAAAPAARAAEGDFERIKALVDHDLKWLDLAEHILKKLPQDDPETKLGYAYLYNAKGESAGKAAEKRAIFEKKALPSVEAYRKTAPKGHRLESQAISLEAAIRRNLARTYEEIIRDPSTSEADRKELIRLVNETRQEAHKGLREALEKAWKDYEKALADWRNPTTADSKKAEEAKIKAYDSAVRATQIYLNALVKDAEAQDPGSEEQKALGKLIVACVNEFLGKHGKGWEPEIPEGVQMSVRYFLGRGYVFAGDVAKACTEGFDKVLEFDPEQFDEAGKKFAIAYRRVTIYFKTLALVEVARKSGKEEDWRTAEQALLHDVFYSPPEDPLRIKAHILKGEILGSLGKTDASKFEQGLNELYMALEGCAKLAARRGSGDERHAEIYKQETHEAMAELINKAGAGGVGLAVEPEVMVVAGLSLYRQQKFEEAVRCFARAVERSRGMADLAKRLVLEGEPKAWFAMGVAYYKMERYLEAQLAYEGALFGFFGDPEGEDWNALPAKLVKDPKNKRLLDDLRKHLITCAGNGRAAAGRELALNSRSKFNSQRLEDWLDWEVRLDPAKREEIAYYKAVRIMEAGLSAAEEAKALERERKESQARAKRQEALDLFLKAESAFLKLPETSRKREDGIFQAGICCYQAMGVLSRKTATKDERSMKLELSERVLAHFAAYKKWVEDKPVRVSTTDPDKAREEKEKAEASRAANLDRIVLLEPFIYYEREEYAQALQAAEKLAGKQGLRPAEERNLRLIRFRCLLAVAAKQEDLDKMEEAIGRAMAEAKWVEEQAAKSQGAEQEAFKDLHRFMVLHAASAYGSARKKAVDLQSPDKATEENNKLRDRAIAFQKQQAGLLMLIIDEMLKGQGEVTPDSLGSLAQLFFETEQYEQAKYLYEELLKRFDADGDRKGIADDKLISLNELIAALKTTKSINTVELLKAGERRLSEIMAYALGREASKDKITGKLIPAVEKNYPRAMDLVNAFIEDYPDYGLDEKGQAGPARASLEKLRDELAFRLKLVKASNQITTCYVELGKEMRSQDPEKAKEYFEKGAENARQALKYWPKDADILLMEAVCLLETGQKANIEMAIKKLGVLREGLQEGGPAWWEATRYYVRALKDAGGKDNWELARKIIVDLLLNRPRTTVDNWPNMDAFIEDLSKLMGVERDQFLPAEVKVRAFDYTARTALEKEVEKQKRLGLPARIRDGSMTKEQAELAEQLLDELVGLEKAGKLAALKDPEGTAILIVNGRVRSLVNLGGASRGDENDKFIARELEGKGGGQ